MDDRRAVDSGEENAWNTRDLAAAIFAGCGVWLMVESLLHLSTLLRFWEWPRDLGGWLGFAATPLCGVALFLGSRRLAGVVFRESECAPPPKDIAALLGVGLAVAGVFITLEQVDAVTRVVVPFLVYELHDPISLRTLLGDVALVACGVMLFARSGVVAGWWYRWNTTN